MAEARRRETYDHTSALMAAVFNSQRGKRDKLISAAQLNPFTAAEHKRKNRIKDPRILAGWFGIRVS